jgi:phosphate transport system permease protein
MKKIRISDLILKSLIYIFSGMTMIFLVWIIGYIVLNGIRHISLDFIITQYGFGDTGILPMIINTLYLIIVSLLISTPISIFTAIYLVEYSRPGSKIVAAIRFAIECLAGIPSIIYGLFGLLFFVILLKFKMSILSGAFTLAIMVMPVLIRTTEESLKSIPNSYREGSLALGATKLQTIIRVVLPSAVSGILSAIILSVGRIVGETAALVLTAGTAGYYFIQFKDTFKHLSDSGRSLSVHLFQVAMNGKLSEQPQAFATATILLFIVAIINFSSTMIAKKLDKTGV